MFKLLITSPRIYSDIPIWVVIAAIMFGLLMQLLFISKKPTPPELDPSRKLVTVTGILPLFGFSAVRFEADRLWTSAIKFKHWRINDGERQDGELYVSEKTSQDVAHDRLDIPAFTVVQLKAHSSPSDQTYEIVEFLGTVRDSELDQLAEQFKKPIKYHDPDLGTLTLDRQSQTFYTEYKLNGEPLKLGVYALNEVEMDLTGLSDLKTLLEDISMSEDKYRQCAMTHSGNNSKSGLYSKLKIHAVELCGDGYYEVCFRDETEDGMEDDHFILAPGDMENGLEYHYPEEMV